LPAKKAPPPLTTREQLAAQLRPLLPKAWKLIPYSRNLDVLSQTAVMFHATAIRPTAIQGVIEVDYTVSVISPKVDTDRAQTDLDDDVLEVIHALDTLDWLLFREATPTVVQDNLSWDITITVNTNKE
jgi:hypothetical protein